MATFSGLDFTNFSPTTYDIGATKTTTPSTLLPKTTSVSQYGLPGINIAPISYESIKFPSTVTTTKFRTDTDAAKAKLDSTLQSIAERQAEAIKIPEPTAAKEMSAAEKRIQDYEDERISIIEQDAERRMRQQMDFDKKMQGIIDAQAAASISSIKGIMDKRRAETRDLNAKTLATAKILGAQAGRQIYAPNVEFSLLSGEEKAGMDRLLEIDRVEAQLIAQAEAAASEGKMASMAALMQAQDKILAEKNAALKDLYQTMIDEDKLREDKLEAEAKKSAGIADQLAEVIYSQTKSGQIDEDTLAKYSEQYGINPLDLQAALAKIGRTARQPRATGGGGIGFTRTQLQKLEFAGIDPSDREKALEYLFGEGEGSFGGGDARGGGFDVGLYWLQQQPDTTSEDIERYQTDPEFQRFVLDQASTILTGGTIGFNPVLSKEEISDDDLNAFLSILK
jgi:hypothetical protein